MTTAGVRETVHGTAVAIGGHGVLLLGQSGAGKSDLALRLIDRGAELVADDQMFATPRDGQLWLSAPPRLQGLIELRGLGVHSTSFRREVEARLAFELDRQPERLPVLGQRIISGIAIPTLPLSALEASAAIRIEWALAVLLRDGPQGFDVDGKFG